MKESTILRIALAAAMIGLVALFALSYEIEPDEAMISRLDQMADETALVTGVVVDISQGGSATFIRIEKDEMTTVVIFGKAPILDLGDYIQVKGKVSEDDGSTEVIADEIRVI